MDGEPAQAGAAVLGESELAVWAYAALKPPSHLGTPIKSPRQEAAPAEASRGSPR